MNINPIIFPKISFQSKLILSTAALFISTLMIFLILSVFSGFYQEKILKDDNNLYFNLSKSIGLGNTIMGSTSSFNEQDIEALKSQAFYKELSFVNKAKFNCVAGFFEQGKFSSEIILEAIPNSMMDGPVYRHYWEEGQKEVPIIISSDFLQLYNFVYAPVVGLPPVSIENLSMVPVEITLFSGSKRKKFTAEVIGLSDRFSGIFVPKTFMNWANTYFTGSSESRRDKAIVLIDPRYISDFENYVEAESLHINNESLRMGKAASLIYPISSGLLFLMAMFIVLSVSNFWLQWKWLLERQKENIQLLYYNGFHPKAISKKIFAFLIPFPAMAYLLSLFIGMTLWYIFKSEIMNILTLEFLAIPYLAIFFVSGIHVLILLSLYFAISNYCRKIYI